VKTSQVKIVNVPSSSIVSLTIIFHHVINI
jgi:hypothetical protein